MLTVGEDFQKFTDEFDELEVLAKACKERPEHEGSPLPPGLTFKKPEADNSGVLLESLNEPIRGLGTGRVVFFTSRDFPPGGAFFKHILTHRLRYFRSMSGYSL